MVSYDEKRRNIQKIVLYTSICMLMDNRRKKNCLRRNKSKESGLEEYSEIVNCIVNIIRLRENDREFHFKYTRMSKERFDHLLSRVRDKITKKDTQMRAAITAEERLLITLRYDLIIAYHTKMMTSHLKCPFISSSQTS